MKTGIIVLFFLFAVNLVVLNYWVFSQKSKPTMDISALTQQVMQDSENKDVKAVVIDTCGENCQKQIDMKFKQATSSIMFSDIYQAIREATQGVKLTQQTTSSQTIQNVGAPIAQSQPIVKEYFVQFGSGSLTAQDWTDVPAVAAYVDSTQYTSIKSVVFEASMLIPTGNQTAWVRLYNKTDQHPVWFSEMTISGGQPQLLVSQPISLDSGKKLYQVQMKTQLPFPANLIQARFHMTLN